MSWDLVKVLMACIMATTDACVGWQNRDAWYITFSLLWAFVAGLYMAKVVLGA